MAAIGSTLFALLLWGGILAVFGIFVFEAYTVARELGWLDSDTRTGRRKP